MAEARISQDEFQCSVCLDLLKDPVTTSCGHSYCKICITDCWDQEDEKRVYSCPQCRQTFSPRPALAKNTILAEMVEKLKKTKLPAECFAGAGDVQCDVCTGTKHKAVKSCLVCLNSYCQSHLQQHESFFKGKRHNLTDATGRLQEMICQKHDKILEVFCRTDQTCICVLCLMDEHKNHETVSAAAQRTEKQPQLKETQRSIQQRIQQREKDLQQLREAVETHKISNDMTDESSDATYYDDANYVPDSSGGNSDTSSSSRDLKIIDHHLPHNILKEKSLGTTTAHSLDSANSSKEQRSFSSSKMSTGHCSSEISCSDSSSEKTLHSPINVTSLPNTAKRSKYNKKQYCLYCNKAISKLARHLESVHSTQLDVAKAFSFKKRSHERSRRPEENWHPD